MRVNNTVTNNPCPHINAEKLNRSRQYSFSYNSQVKCFRTHVDIVTCEEFVWLIIPGSGLDDWVYWHFLTITTNYYSSRSIAPFLTSLWVASLALWLTRFWFTSRSASVVRWLTFHSWTLNSFATDLQIIEWRLPYDWIVLLCTYPYIGYH
jgi:hypothetical protein